MIGIYKWGWGDGSENTAFWGWLESLLRQGDAPASIVRGELKPNSVLGDKAPRVVMGTPFACSLADDLKVKTSTGAVTGKTVFLESEAKSVKWEGFYYTDHAGPVPQKVSGDIYTAKSTVGEAAVKTSGLKDKAKAVKR